MFKVKVQSTSFEGQRHGVQFRKGEATVEDKEIAGKLEKMGYEVTDLTPKKEPAKKKKASSKKKGE